MEYLDKDLALIRSQMTSFRQLLDLNQRVLSQLKKYNRELLSWPQPFIMTQRRLNVIEKQQACQEYPDTVNVTLQQIRSQLSHAIRSLETAHLISRG